MNLEFVENLVTLIGEYPLSDIEIAIEGQRIAVRRTLTAALPSTESTSTTAPEAGVMPNPDTTVSGSQPVAETPPQIEMLTAPMVGIFYHADPPLPYAAVLRPGLVVGYIESMKLRNNVVAEDNGRVTDVLVEDGAPVEYGQSLFRFTTSPE